MPACPAAAPAGATAPGLFVMLPTHPRGARRSEALSLWQGHRHPGAGRDGFSTPPAQGGIKIKATPRLPPAPSRSGACARKRSPAGLEPPLPPGSPGPSPVPRRFPGTLPTPVPGRGGSRVARKPLLASAPRRSPPPAPLPHLARRSRAGWPPGRPARGAPRCAAGIPVPARSGPPCPPAPSPWPERGAPLPGGAQAARGAAPLAGGGQRHSMAGRGGARSAAERCFPEGCEARRGSARHGTARLGTARLGSARLPPARNPRGGDGRGPGRAGLGRGAAPPACDQMRAGAEERTQRERGRGRLGTTRRRPAPAARSPARMARRALALAASPPLPARVGDTARGCTGGSRPRGGFFPLPPRSLPPGWGHPGSSPRTPNAVPCPPKMLSPAPRLRRASSRSRSAGWQRPQLGFAARPGLARVLPLSGSSCRFGVSVSNLLFPLQSPGRW